ncbi:uncharacterized protein TRAVEDRAFT_35763 [Trametes versicolor FP-101664 SS1]|uniref:uncharacterized protein n=1 Tax=Trametes versicolor (strain FP-101664) TaxID=717944 RepID=UPI0004624932|nr:uncharacterized protein TRAVEDRAFT_35763 [Trametes versicolor FP-101664 SS1]EIW60021.1 hypothetical protein TRAVEDRAFT_35763 [Trametes versicolor FP-101664 SS1]
MGLFPLSPMFCRPFLGTAHRAARTPPLNGRYFVPSAAQTAARYQHSYTSAEFAQKIRIMLHMKQGARQDWYKFIVKIGFTGLGLGITFLAAPVLYCDPVTSKPAPPTTTTALPPPQGKAVSAQPSTPPPPPPTSSINFYELTFGTVCGVCAGVFVKKGVKAAAFVLGGVFVLLQYLGSLSLVRVNWSSAANRFESVFYSKDPVTGAKRPPNVGSFFRWIIDFLTADFQGRASFVAGFTLGIRIG